MEHQNQAEVHRDQAEEVQRSSGSSGTSEIPSRNYRSSEVRRDQVVKWNIRVRKAEVQGWDGILQEHQRSSRTSGVKQRWEIQQVENRMKHRGHLDQEWNIRSVSSGRVEHQNLAAGSSDLVDHQVVLEQVDLQV
jgi:hypothetical protein